jgi:hypothetical protein
MQSRQGSINGSVAIVLHELAHTVARKPHMRNGRCADQHNHPAVSEYLFQNHQDEAGGDSERIRSIPHDDSFSPSVAQVFYYDQDT